MTNTSLPHLMDAPAAFPGGVSSNSITALTQKTWAVPRLLTQKEAAALTRMSEKWLERDRWVERRIPFVKIGRAVRYRAEDIAAYIEANVQGAA